MKERCSFISDSPEIESPKFQMSYSDGGPLTASNERLGVKKVKTRTSTITNVTIKALDENKTPVADNFCFSCNLNIRRQRTTFVGRKLAVLITSKMAEGAKPIGISISDFDATDLHLLGGVANQAGDPNGGRKITGFGRVTAEWKAENRALLRDIALLAIGALLGLAASCLPEWVRPFIGPVE